MSESVREDIGYKNYSREEQLQILKDIKKLNTPSPPRVKIALRTCNYRGSMIYAYDMAMDLIREGKARLIEVLP